MTLASILNLIFLVVIALFAITGLLGLYVYLRYGRSLTFTLASSAVFVVLFLIGSIAAFGSLQNLISLYGG